MTMARDEYIFLIILAVNLIVSVLYLAAGIVLMVPARIAGGWERRGDPV
ncbi:hypothetical protein [Schaedlerella arabinosiphila]|nr:hypothetical protein [Schaedlerella arabinosiphila]